MDIFLYVGSVILAIILLFLILVSIGFLLMKSDRKSKAEIPQSVGTLLEILSAEINAESAALKLQHAASRIEKPENTLLQKIKKSLHSESTIKIDFASPHHENLLLLLAIDGSLASNPEILEIDSESGSFYVHLTRRLNAKG